jgi:hypothetical protein
MSKQWDKQKQGLRQNAANISKIYGRGQNSPFVEDAVSRQQNEFKRGVTSYENASERGNPLSIVANEEKPNPVRRMKMMMAAKNNAKA